MTSKLLTKLLLLRVIMLGELKTVLSVFLLIPLIGLVGLVFSFSLRFVQCTHALKAWRFFFKDRDHSGKRASSFSAVSAVLGGNLGTGNISGIAVALTMGGPGAIFWMWIMATLGSILKFVGCTLGIMYRKKNSKGQFVGGPMYYLANGLGLKKMGKIYCVLAILAAVTVGNLVQMNSLALPFIQAGIEPYYIGIVMSLLVAGVIFGGLKRFSQVASFVVPFLALGYILSCLIILLLHFDKILPATHLIFSAAFDSHAVAGAVLGYAVIEAIRVGFDRGVFATDIGIGIDAIVHSSVECENKSSLTEMALKQGLISTLSPLIVMLVCTLTGLVLLTTGAWQSVGIESTNLCVDAFRRGFGFDWAGQIITVTLFFFAFTTILTWSFCADKAIEYLFSEKWIKPFQCLFVCFIPFGAYLQVSAVWTLADIFMNLMVIVNMCGLIGLYKKVATLYRTPERKSVFA